MDYVYENEFLKYFKPFKNQEYIQHISSSRLYRFYYLLLCAM